MRHPGDPSTALEAVVNRFRALVRSVAARHALRDQDLDALVQEVRIRLWRGATTSEAIQRLPTSYVYQTARSAAIDLVRQRQRRDAREVDDGDAALSEVSGVRSTEQHAEWHELAACVEEILGGMLASRRVVVRMSLAGYSRQDIAARLGWSEAKVRNLLSRGLTELREQVRDRVQSGVQAPAQSRGQAVAASETPRETTSESDTRGSHD